MASTPTLILPDTAPLIHLAAGGLLGVLPAPGRVLVPDIVALEATRQLSKPWAREVADWLASDAATVVETDLGDLYRFAIEQGRKPPRGAGEISILRWLLSNLDATREGAVVVSDDNKVPRLMAHQELEGRVAALTTADLLELAEQKGILASAALALERIVSRAPTAPTLSFRKPAP